jgi:hypothetical protein
MNIRHNLYKRLIHHSNILLIIAPFVLFIFHSFPWVNQQVTTRTIRFAKSSEVDSFIRIALRLNPNVPLSRHDLHLASPNGDRTDVAAADLMSSSANDHARTKGHGGKKVNDFFFACLLTPWG